MKWPVFAFRTVAIENFPNGQPVNTILWNCKVDLRPVFLHRRFDFVNVFCGHQIHPLSAGLCLVGGVYCQARFAVLQFCLYVRKDRKGVRLVFCKIL